jgi:hypothetical protein
VNTILGDTLKAAFCGKDPAKTATKRTTTPVFEDIAPNIARC